MKNNQNMLHNKDFVAIIMQLDFSKDRFMDNIVKSQGWDWAIVDKKAAEPWLVPSKESYYFLHRWAEQGKKDMLDLGCGLGRHSLQFARAGFNVFALDISPDAVEFTHNAAMQENLNVTTQIGDMLSLPYADKSIDCIFCRNVMSHTDTNGIKKIIAEMKRVLRENGEIYCTLAAKETWGFKQDWPMVDENTKLRMEEGPEYNVPHFYADFELIKELFHKDFMAEDIYKVCGYQNHDGEITESWHYHLLMKKK